MVVNGVFGSVLELLLIICILGCCDLDAVMSNLVSVRCLQFFVALWLCFCLSVRMAHPAASLRASIRSLNEPHRNVPGRHGRKLDTPPV